MNQFFKIYMDNQILSDAVHRVLAYLAKDNAVFTAFQVTEMLRAEVGPTVPISHSSVRDVVHDAMSNFVHQGYYDIDYSYTAPNGKSSKQYFPTELWAFSQSQLALPSPTNAPLKVEIPNIRINSTLVRGISFDGNIAEGELTVKLDNGVGDTNTYIYSNVPFQVYLDFINADSKGVYFNSNVRGKFASVKDSKSNGDDE